MSSCLSTFAAIKCSICGFSNKSGKADDGVQFVPFSEAGFSRSGGQADLFRCVIDNVDYVIKAFKQHENSDSISPEILGALQGDDCPDALLKAVAWDFGTRNKNKIHMIRRVRLAFSVDRQAMRILYHGCEDFETQNFDKWIRKVPIIIYPFYEAGSLSTVIDDRQRKRTDPAGPLFSIDEVAQVFSDLFAAVDVFWKCDKRHNDIKSSNILLKTDSDTGTITKATLCDPGHDALYTWGFFNPDFEVYKYNSAHFNSSVNDLWKAEKDDTFAMCVVLGALFSVDVIPRSGYASGSTLLLFWRRPNLFEEGFRHAATMQDDMERAMKNIHRSVEQRKAFGEDESKVQAFGNILTWLAASKPSQEKMEDVRRLLELWRDGRYNEILRYSPIVDEDGKLAQLWHMNETLRQFKMNKQSQEAEILALDEKIGNTKICCSPVQAAKVRMMKKKREQRKQVVRRLSSHWLQEYS